MQSPVYVFDPTAFDTLSNVRGVGRYLQILKENFPDWNFSNKLLPTPYTLHPIFLNPFFNFLQPPTTMRRIAQKQIAVIHDLIPLKYPSHFPVGIKGKINVFLNTLALKNYDTVVTDSEASKKDIIKILGISDTKVKIIYPCLPKIFTDKRIAYRVSSMEDNTKYPILHTPYCLYVGDATWNKNLVNLARAIKIINITCIFVGKVFSRAAGVASEVSLREADGGIHSRASQERRDHARQNLPRLTHLWQKELKQFLEEIKDDKRFILKGFVPDEELIQLYRQARVNILSSRDEGFGFSYLEAGSQQCPSILSDIDVLHEISHNDALFADPNNPRALADSIGELYFHQDVRDDLGSKAYERSKQFSSATFKRHFLTIIP